MGNGSSKFTTDLLNTRGSGSMAPKIFEGFSDSDNIRVESIQRDDLMAISIIKRELNGHAERFILNNLIMSVQFFTDHKELTKRLQQSSVSPQEKEMNKTLLKDETMECTYPDAIMEEVNKNIVFRRTGEYSKSENLAPRRIYVKNDLIEVVKSDEIPQYTSIDRPCYQVKVEKCRRDGFVSLVHIENNAPILTNHEYDENYEPLPGPSSRSDSEYDYSRITDMRTPKPIELDDANERRDTLPDTCFTHKKVKVTAKKDFDDDGSDAGGGGYLENISEEDFIKVVTYVNSEGFMKHFQNVVFPSTLGRSLGFSEDSIAMAKCIPGKVFCDSFDLENDIKEPFEIIPAIAIPWPDNQTVNFVKRDARPTIIDTRTGTKYIWPTTGPGSMMEDIRKLTAMLVPKGYTKKRGENRNSNLEWEIHFPKAERYLEARMSHAQMKCMLLLLTLHKTFICPVTGQNGLLIEHIRTHMYWECELDYRNWPEHRLGTKILKVIENLKNALFLGSLPDFFIKEKNLFENIPKKYLLFAQKVFLDILANPVAHFIMALRNIRYASGKFYPPLDLKELYEGLKTKTSAALVNPHLAQPKIPQLKKRLYKDPDQQIKHLRYLKKKERILMKAKEEENRKAKEMNAKKNEDIDLEEPIGKELDIWRTKAILVMFIKHFIDIAKKSSNIASANQALFYLKQASYLSKVLEDVSASFSDEVQEHRQVIATEEARVKRKSITSLPSSDEKPQTPIRNNSMSFQFGEISQQLKSGSSSVVLNRLQAAYVNGFQTPPSMKSGKAVQRGDSYKQNGGAPTKRKTVAFVE